MLEPRIEQRAINQTIFETLLSDGIPEFEASIIAKRSTNEAQALLVAQPKLKDLDNPFLMADMNVAVDRLIVALDAGEVIGIETDHDCDGQTSHAVIYEALVKLFRHPSSNIRSYIGHRMKEGYGLSDALADRILEDQPAPTLIITADNGSTDQPRIDRLLQAGIETIVTDHHAIPQEGIPKSACAVLNPTRKDCRFPDSAIAGCMVAWLFMAATRRKLLEQGKLTSSMSMAELLDFVAVGTVADCVSMANSVNNRAVTLHGMKRISALSRTCWQAFRNSFQKEIGSEFIGFTIGPLLNSDGRLSDAFSSVNFLLSESVHESNEWVNELSKQNAERKAIQKRITDAAMKEAYRQVDEGRQSIVVYLNQGHAGVHGISASRVKDAVGRPTILFSPKEGEDLIISGSARGIDGLNLKAILDEVNQLQPELLVKYGGHSGAAGMTLYKEKFQAFSELFEKCVSGHLQKDTSIVLGPITYVDGALENDLVSLSTVERIKSLEPFGRGFEYPVFSAQAKVLSKRMVGQEMQHAQFMFDFGGKKVKGIWFNAISFPVIYRVNVGDQVKLACKLVEEYFNNQRNLSIMVEYLEK